MSNKAGIVLALILLLIGSIYLFLTSGIEETPEGSAAPVMEFSDTELHETKDGKLVWQMQVSHIEMDADKNTANLSGVTGYFKNEDMELHLKADKGKARRNEKMLYLEGNVQGTTTDGAVLYAENLTYDGKTGKLSTDKSFILDKDGKELTADSFTADRVLQKVEAKGHAKLTEKENGQ